MLIQFRVENHRSLRDEQVLSLAASSNLSDKRDAHVLRAEGLGEALVPVIAIYGANASGKTNVLTALEFMRSAVLESQRIWEVEGTPQEPFSLSSKAREPSLYEVDIVVDGVRFRYGFQLSAVRVEEEWLFAWPHGRRAMWFEREGDHFEFGKTLQGENEAIRGFTRPNSLFLSAAAQSNHAALLPIFRSFAAWQFSLMRLSGMSRLAMFSSEIVRSLSFKDGAADKAAIMQLLQAADTGILDVRVEKPDSSARDHEGKPRNHPAALFRHRAASEEHSWLPLAAESAGTVALLELAPHIVGALRSGGLLCIDELEASLHPALAHKVLGLFNDAKRNPRGAQLIFTTHDTNLLGPVVGEPPLRRDQIWFTEKDEHGGTSLYPLTDFHPRKEENFERGYLQGRYGAIPFLGELVTSGEADEDA